MTQIGTFSDDIEEAQYSHSLPERPKLRRLQANQNYKDSLQKANWEYSSSGSEILRFDYSR